MPKEHPFELLAPAGNREMLDTVLYFGADAVYAGLSSYSLRAYAGNFEPDALIAAANAVHAAGKKIYVALNVFARNSDFTALDETLSALAAAKIDAVIVSDLGMLQAVKQSNAKLDIHISTQANVTNAYAALTYAELGATRIVLARELSLGEIAEVSALVKGRVALEAFVHGAMCVSYSGRCLLSNITAGRPSNLGMCAQTCRLSYELYEPNSRSRMDIVEDGQGTYILNSKDLNMAAHLTALIDAGITSFKIEGRAKSAYYAATVTGVYRRALDDAAAGRTTGENVLRDLDKAGNRGYTTGFYFPDRKECLQNTHSAKPQATHTFIGKVVGVFDGGALVEMRNRFCEGEIAEVLSPHPQHNTTVPLVRIENASGEPVSVADRVQDIYRIYTPILLSTGDMLRRKT